MEGCAVAQRLFCAGQRFPSPLEKLPTEKRQTDEDERREENKDQPPHAGCLWVRPVLRSYVGANDKIGADDYVTKPFNSRELVARIRTVLRRAQGAVAAPIEHLKVYRFAGWVVSARDRELINPEGARVSTTSAEFDLLVALCQNPGAILSREQLLELTHGGSAGPIERTIDVHISRIRQKMEPNPREPTFIKTVRLGGYMFTARPEVL
jgi:DNA-binding winged helix-turn-helix (wHTH) protein/CheY-like chemotaxis protein